MTLLTIYCKGSPIFILPADVVSGTVVVVACDVVGTGEKAKLCINVSARNQKTVAGQTTRSIRRIKLLHTSNYDLLLLDFL